MENVNIAVLVYLAYKLDLSFREFLYPPPGRSSAQFQRVWISIFPTNDVKTTCLLTYLLNTTVATTAALRRVFLRVSDSLFKSYRFRTAGVQTRVFVTHSRRPIFKTRFAPSQVTMCCNRERERERSHTDLGRSYRTITREREREIRIRCSGRASDYQEHRI